MRSVRRNGNQNRSCLQRSRPRGHARAVCGWGGFLVLQPLQNLTFGSIKSLMQRVNGRSGNPPRLWFLSENEDFAQAIEDAGMIFIGPSAKSIEVMGKQVGRKGEVVEGSLMYPLFRATSEPIDDINKAKKIAKILAIRSWSKARAVVESECALLKRKEFQEQMERAVSEATSAFGDGSVFIENTSPNRDISSFRFWARHGNVVHFIWAWMSIQRRHQKVAEEAPLLH